MRYGVGWVVALALTALASPASAEESRWALLVGIDDYIDDAISPLTGSVADVVAMREALVAVARFPSAQVFLLTSDEPGSEPTTGNIVARLKYIAEHADSDDLVYVHFSLHAVVDDATGEGYLFTHRTDPNDYQRDGLRVSEVRTLLEGMVAPKQILVLDGCRNDPERGRGDQPNHLDDRFSRGVRITPRAPLASAVSFQQVFFACGVGQRAYEWPGKERGLFSVALEEGLRGAAGKDGTVTLGGLTAYVRSRVPELVELHLPGRQQTPDVPEPSRSARAYELAKVDPAASEAAQRDGQELPPRIERPDATEDVRGGLVPFTVRQTTQSPRVEIIDRPLAPLSPAQARLLTLRWEPRDLDGHAAGYRWQLNGNEPVETERSSATELHPGPGEHRFLVQVRDRHGNWSAAAEARFTVLHNRRPLLAIVSPPGGADGARAVVEDTGLRVKLSGEDPDGRVVTYRLALDDQDAFQDAVDGEFSLGVPTDGPHTLHAWAIDDEGLHSLHETRDIFFRFAEGGPARGSSAGAERWVRGEPHPTIEGFRYVKTLGNRLPEYELDLAPDVAMRFVLVPAGSFRMGSPPSERDRLPSEGPQRDVTLDAFLLARTECTQRQWHAVMGGEEPLRDAWGSADTPQAAVSWDDIQVFEVRTGLGLPTEAQWEYAARAGTQDSYAGQVDAIAWHAGNSEGRPRVVGTRSVNAFGLHDMSGSVWEWCEDAWRADFVDAPLDGKPVADPASSTRVARGGSWKDPPAKCRSASRFKFGPGSRLPELGFRPARRLP